MNYAPYEWVMLLWPESFAATLHEKVLCAAINILSVESTINKKFGCKRSGNTVAFFRRFPEDRVSSFIKYSTAALYYEPGFFSQRIWYDFKNNCFANVTLNHKHL